MMRGEGGLQFRATTSFLDGDVQARFGMAVRAGDDHPWTFDESSISAPFGAGRIYASVERRHWGPSWTGSLILDAGARPLPAVGWRKDDSRPFVDAPFSWLARGGPTCSSASWNSAPDRTGPPDRCTSSHADRRPRAGDLADDAVGRQRPARVGGIALSRPHRPGQRRKRRPRLRAGQPARRLRRALHLSLGGGRSASIYGQAIGEDEANAPAEPLPRQRRRRSRPADRRCERCASSSSTRTPRPGTPTARRSSARPIAITSTPTATPSSAIRSAIRPGATPA